jgi:CubicO group peptidase (beta-lactamase class C family)
MSRRRRLVPPLSRRLALAVAATAMLVAACSDGDAPDTAPATGDTSASTTTNTTVPEAASSTTPSTTPSTTSTSDSAPPAASSTAAEPIAQSDRDFSMVSPIVEQFVAERAMNGAGVVIVHRDDGIVFEQYWGEFAADRASLIASSSKMIVAGVLLALDDQGLLDVDAPVADVVSWGAANPEVTPAQLLSNSSGLVGLFPNPAYGPYLCQYLPQGTLAECAEQIFTTPDDDAEIRPPDTEYRYGGGQWQVAGAVAEAAADSSWTELIDQIYVEPCGVDSLAFNNHWTQLGPVGFTYPSNFDGDPSTLADTDNPNMEGGAYITPPDYAKLLLMHLRGGRCGETQVLSAAAIDRMHADRIGDVYAGSASGQGYGMGWFIDRGTGRISDPGAYGSTPWLDLDGGYGVYLVVEADGATGAALASLLADPIDAVMTPG